jgi:hypothetical protein
MRFSQTKPSAVIAVAPARRSWQALPMRVWIAAGRALMLTLAAACVFCGSSGGGGFSFGTGGGGVAGHRVAQPSVGGNFEFGDSGSPPPFSCDAGGGPNCPSALPMAGAPCAANPAIECEFGDDPLAECNTTASCKGGSWSLTEPSPVNCPTRLPASCPPTFAAARGLLVSHDAGESDAAPADGSGADVSQIDASGSDASQSGAAPSLAGICNSAYVCLYPQGACECSSIAEYDGSTLWTWACTTPTPGCPPVRPRYGTPSGSNAPPGECAYSYNCEMMGVASFCGVWQSVNCPPMVVGE